MCSIIYNLILEAGPLTENKENLLSVSDPVCLIFALNKSILLMCKMILDDLKAPTILIVTFLFNISQLNHCKKM
jgi:hypothetical protein